MTKRQVARELRDVMTGNSGHTWIGIEKLNKGWKVYTSMSNPFMQLNFKHSCNKLSLKEAENILNEALLNGLQSL